MNALKHRPIDFTVPLLTEYGELQQLWTPTIAPLKELPTLDLFSERTSQEALVAKGAKAVAAQQGLAAAIGE